MKRMMFVFHGLLLIGSVCVGAQAFPETKEPVDVSRAIRLCCITQIIIRTEEPGLLDIGECTEMALSLGVPVQLWPQKRQDRIQAVFQATCTLLKSVQVAPLSSEELEFMDQFPDMVNEPLKDSRLHRQMNAWMKKQTKENLDAIDRQAEEIYRTLEPQIKENFRKK